MSASNLPQLSERPLKRHECRAPRSRSTALRVCSHRSRRGFSLIEVMCAILILSIGLVGLTHGVTTALSSSKEAELQSAAALLAAGQIEMLRAEGWILAGETEGQGGPGLTLYQWRQSVTTTSLDGLFEVTVTVEHSGTGKQIYKLTTLLFDPPILSSLDSNEDRRDRERSRDQRGRNR